MSASSSSAGTATTQFVTSRDGTRIAYERTGPASGLTGGAATPVIIVDGALCYRAFGPSRPVAAQLAGAFSVITYDRRGRGESGDRECKAPDHPVPSPNGREDKGRVGWGIPHAVEREIEDLEALIAAAGGSAQLVGFSSGAALALEAAARLRGVTRIAMFEAPFIVDDGRPPVTDEYMETLRTHLAAGRNGAAAKRFMRLVGVPAFGIFTMQFMPMWKKLKAVAPTLLYDAAIVDQYQRGTPLPADRWRSATQPVLVLVGGKSPDWMQSSMRSLATVLPHATLESLPGQTHMVKEGVIAPVLARFFAS